MIRLAGPEDAKTVARISRETFRETFGPLNSRENMELFMKEQFSQQELESQVCNTDFIFYLSYCDDQLCGYAALRKNNNPTGLDPLHSIEISRIYVTADFIKKGIGKRLMQHCLDEAKTLGKKAVWLGVWEHNLRAIEFYQSWGFEKFGTHPFKLGLDLQTDWLLKKVL